jgi:hypothetical protein
VSFNGIMVAPSFFQIGELVHDVNEDRHTETGGPSLLISFRVSRILMAVTVEGKGKVFPSTSLGGP